MSNIGTPQSLDEAIQRAICFGPMNQIGGSAYFIIRDFLAQKFQAAFITATDDEVKKLQALFENITKRESDAKN